MYRASGKMKGAIPSFLFLTALTAAAFLTLALPAFVSAADSARICLPDNVTLHVNETIYITNASGDVQKSVITDVIPCPFGCVNSTLSCRPAAQDQMYQIIGSIFLFMSVLVISVYVSDRYFPYVAVVTSLILGVFSYAIAWMGIYPQAYAMVFYVEAATYIVMAPILAYRQIRG